MSGNLFKNKCEKIRSDLAVYVQQSIINEIKETYPDIELIPIGSVGKRKDDDYNGDIEVMKKSELEKAYRELQYRYNKLQSDTSIEIENLKWKNEVNLKNQKSDIEDKVYETWKLMNEKFMKRYIE